uniref:Codanin-1 C-terminal domain-containing protein n=1 Tax=Dendroctonus ponderosae TaxID=77166 RepID=A0AAR5QJV6_DENPD
MADLLLNKLVNGQISSEVLSKWLLHTEPEGQEEFKEIEDTKVSQLRFVTCFLNFVHDQAPSDSALSATPQKLHNPKTAEKKASYGTPDSTRPFKTALFPPHHAQRQTPGTNSNSDYQNGNHISTSKNKNTFSPISPLSASRKNNSSFTDRTTQDRYKFSLEDFRVKTPKSSSKKKKKSEVVENRGSEASRRIKPTNICPRESNKDAFQKNGNSFSFENSSQELAAGTATEQRAVLAEEKANIVLRRESFEANYCRPALHKRQCSPSKVETPILELVTYKSHLDNVIDIYKTVLDHQLTLNITSEIYFLISLFLIKQQDQSKFCEANNSRVTKNSELDDLNLGVNPLDSNDDCFKHIGNTSSDKLFIYNSQIFESVHNLVYFAITALETQTKVIQLYDKATIRLLAENDRVKEFAPDFAQKLITYAEENSESSYTESTSEDSQTNVCFNIDTDNQAIFPDQISFHAFRKQRDLFYEILRIWEIHHLTADWNFANGLGGKINALFGLHNGSANLMHLARLFKNQLLSSCAKGPKEKGLSENGVAFISSLRIDADKLNRLTNRLVTKQATNGINALPTFTGYQDFFKEFMDFSVKCQFGMHLRDCLIFGILELNGTDFSGVGLDEEGNEVDVNARNLYANCIRNLRVLAKFLGYLETLPYKADARKLSRSLVEAQIEIRQQIRPALDVKSLLESAIEKRTVVLIVPWLTKYLAMLDYVTLRLPYYKALNVRLFRLYQNCEGSETPHCNVAVVKFCLGWLFEMPHFPATEYLQFCSEIPAGVQNLSNGKSATGKCLDCMGIMNRRLLYLCCPYLDEMKKILASNAPGSKIAVKYITPVTAVASDTETSRKKLEQQLEDAFFSGQPSSLKRTVEFVSERVASTAIKFICQELVPLAKAEANTEWKDYLNSVKTTEAHSDHAQTKKVWQAQVTTVAQKHLSKLLPNCDQEAQKLMDIKIAKSLDGLLPVDALEGTKQICVTVTKKMCTERVKQWMVGHVSLALFTKDFESDILKMFLSGRRKDKEKSSFLLPQGGRDCSHNETAISGFHTVNNLREYCCKVMENCDITAKLVAKLLNDTYESLTQRNDLNDNLIVTLCAILLDFYILLVAKYPSIFAQKDLLAEFTRIWALHPKSAVSFKTLLAPRNVHILQGSKNTEESWSLYARLVSSLLNNKFVDLDDLESQCTGFYNKDWDAGTLNSYSHFLKTLVSFSSGEGKEKFVFLLNFLSDFCSDL